jgi:hypothetical protein
MRTVVTMEIHNLKEELLRNPTMVSVKNMNMARRLQAAK